MKMLSDRPESASVAQDGAARVVSPAPRDVWRQAAVADPDAVATQTSEWCDWLCHTRGYTDASRLYEFDDGRRLVLPLMARAAGRIYLTEESMPYGFGYGGPVVAGDPPTPREARVIVDDLARRPILRTALTTMPLVAAPWAASAPETAVRLPYLAQVLDCRGGFDAVWSTRYRKDTRTKVRRVEKQSLDIRVQDAITVSAFTELNRRSVERWARQRGQPLVLARLVERRRGRASQLRSAATSLPEICTVWSAHRAGEPVAAYATLGHGQHTIFWMSAMDKRLAAETKAGYLLQSLAIEAACRAGARWFHFGESDPGSGVERFKAAFGAAPVRYEALRFERLPLTGLDQHVRAAVGRLGHRGAAR
jgi:Acetyltransferase (GNAT) domain